MGKQFSERCAGVEKRTVLLPLRLKRNPAAALAFTKKLTLCPGGVLQNTYQTVS